MVDTELILLLEQGPVGPSAALLDNLIEEGLIIDTVAQDGILTIDLDEDIFDDISRQDDQTRGDRTDRAHVPAQSLRGVGQALFTFNGSEQNVSVPTGNALFTESTGLGRRLRVDAGRRRPGRRRVRRRTPTDDTATSHDHDVPTRPPSHERAPVSSRDVRPGPGGAASPCRP